MDTFLFFFFVFIFTDDGTLIYSNNNATISTLFRLDVHIESIKGK